MKKVILTSLLTLIAVMTHAEDSTSNEPNALNTALEQPSIRVITRPDILGLWGMEIPNNQQCTEYYNFRGDNELVIKSDQEWSIGQFQYQVPNNRSEQLPALALHIKYDNNGKDCSGLQEDQSGEIQQFFVKWMNPQQIQFCASENGEKCFAVLNKYLP